MSRPFIPAPHCATVELIYGVYSQVIENVFAVQSNAAFSASDLTALRTCFNNWDAAQWYNARSVSVLLTRIRTKALDSSGSPMEDYALPTPRGGTGSTAPAPLNVTFCYKLSTGLAGRSQRGRLYMPGISTGSLNGNQIIAAHADSFLTRLNSLPAALTAANPNWKWGVLSYRADKTWRSVAQFTPITTAVYTDLNIDSQRRRLTGRGRT